MKLDPSPTASVPKNVWTQDLATDNAAAFLVQTTCQTAPESLPDAQGLPEVVDGRSRSACISRLLVAGEGIQVVTEDLHGGNIPFGRSVSIPFGMSFRRADTARMATNNADVVHERRKRLQAWIDDHFAGNRQSFIARTGINSGELSGLLRTKSFGEKRAAEIEKLAGMPAGHLVTPIAKQDAAMPDLDMLRTAIRIFDGIRASGGLDLGSGDAAEAIVMVYRSLATGEEPGLAGLAVMRYAATKGGGYGISQSTSSGRDRKRHQ